MKTPKNQPSNSPCSALVRSALVLGAIAGLALAGCAGKPFKAAAPPGFVVLEDRYEDDEWRATTADGVVLGARAFKNEPKGEVAFWSRAIQNRLRDMGGYALLDTKQVKNRGDLTGTQMRFGHDEAGEPHVYVISVFANDKKVFLVEAGGTKAQMERFSAQVDWSVQNFLPK